MDLALTSFPTVNGLGCAKVRTNFYSVPLAAGIEVHAKAYASRVELSSSITSMCCGGSRGLWPDPQRLTNNAKRVCGR
jgi:hypothetical protein